MWKMWGFTTLLLVASLALSNGDSIWDPDTTDMEGRIYQKFKTGSACVRLTDANGPIGCSVSGDTTTAPLWPVADTSEVDNFVASPPSEGVMIVMPYEFLRRSYVEPLLATGRVKGLLVDAPSGDLTDFSPDLAHPNQQWGLHPNSDYVWNPSGDGLLFDQFEIPVWRLDSTDAAELWKRAEENEKDDLGYPQYVAEVYLEMTSKQRTSTNCFKRRDCLPVGGHSVWGNIRPLTDNTSDIYVVMAPMDSNAFFHDDAFGARAEISGIVSLLATAHALSTVDLDYQSEVVFALFEGESWGYVGSKRFVKEVQDFTCLIPWSDADRPGCQVPQVTNLDFTMLSLDRIKAAIEFRNIGPADEDKLYIHREHDGNAETDQLVSDLLNAQNAVGSVLFESASTSTPGLPPSSLNPFLKARSDLPGVLISDHSETYRNSFYHSSFDTRGSVVSADSVCASATVVARYLHEAAFGTPPDAGFRADCDFVSQLLDCFVDDFSCSLLKEYIPGLSADEGDRLSIYASVYQWSTPSTWSYILFEILGSLLATESTEISCSSHNDCDSFGYNHCSEGVCHNTTVWYHDAVSPGIEYDYSSHKWVVVNDTEPTWAESNWPDSPYIRVYIRSSEFHDGMVLFLGLMVTLVSFAACYAAEWYYTAHVKQS